MAYVDLRVAAAAHCGHQACQGSSSAVVALNKILARVVPHVDENGPVAILLRLRWNDVMTLLAAGNFVMIMCVGWLTMIPASLLMLLITSSLGGVPVPVNRLGLGTCVLVGVALYDFYDRVLKHPQPRKALRQYLVIDILAWLLIPAAMAAFVVIIVAVFSTQAQQR